MQTCNEKIVYLKEIILKLLDFVAISIIKQNKTKKSKLFYTKNKQIQSEIQGCTDRSIFDRIDLLTILGSIIFFYTFRSIGKKKLSFSKDRLANNRSKDTIDRNRDRLFLIVFAFYVVFRINFVIFIF